MKRIECDKRLIDLRCVVVAKVRQVMLAKIAVNAVLVGTLAESGVVLPYGVRPTEVAETQTDGAIGVGDAAFVFVLERLIKVVPG